MFLEFDVNGLGAAGRLASCRPGIVYDHRIMETSPSGKESLRVCIESRQL